MSLMKMKATKEYKDRLIGYGIVDKLIVTLLILVLLSQ